MEPSGGRAENCARKQQQMRKSRRGPRSRSSQYRGVTFYRRTGRWESHIWDCGKQVYLGKAYDRAAIKFRGVDADINFNLSDYDEDMKQMRNLGKEEFVHALRRKSTGYVRGSSKYRGVNLHKCGRWEARMGQFHGKKAYDIEAIKWRSDHNLDLSLGISSSANDSKANNNERVAEKRVEADSSPKSSSWLWKINGNNNNNNVATVSEISSSFAASSGFSSSATITASSTTFPFNHQSHSVKISSSQRQSHPPQTASITTPKGAQISSSGCFCRYAL
ncbi:hypothetical protein GH714_021406 [Hevea brasiliensis]|uniref:AP2/ERF domain-containing protein n=1 Tax=Hevea brasiliensis TaxID=3981 RepID=A0A6A6L1T1_HEVBR|nr:hypothetical protein GH714_021406 [Hevea brasiliensis]